MTEFIQPQFDSIPTELQILPRWLTWRAEYAAPGEKPRKVPYAPDRPNTRASSTDPQTWGTFNQAEASFLDGDRTGVGIVLNGDGLVGVDIDNCVIDGATKPDAMALLDQLGAAYIELSPSGTGLRAFGYADGLTTGCKGKLSGLDVELYSTGRYLTLTGVTIKAGPIGALRGFAELADSIRADRKVNPATGKAEQVPPDQYHAALVQRVLSGDVYHDSLRDLAASLVATGMQPGAVVNHLRGLMDNSAGAHDDRWQARRGQIPDLVSSAERKFAPLPDVDFSGLNSTTIDNDTGEILSGKSADDPQDVSIADLASFAPTAPQFWADQILPADVVTLLGAHGGTGKTTLALYAAVCLAMGLPFLGKQTKAAKVLFYSAEDDTALLRWRLASVCQRLAVDPVALSHQLSVVDASEADSVLYVEASRNGVRVGEPTAAFQKLVNRMAAHGTQVVIIDNASDVFGADEINRVQVRSFIRLLAKLVKPVHGAVLLLAHVDKLTARTGGTQGYSGSTAWHNSVRSRLFLSEQDDGRLLLEHQKSNRGKKADPQYLVWDDGLPMPANEVTGFDVSNLLGRVDDDRAIVMLKLIAEFESREQYCATSLQARNNVFAMLRSEPGFQSLKLNADSTKRIVTRCQRAKWVMPLDYKNTERKPRQRWTLTPAGRDFAGLCAPTSESAHPHNSADMEMWGASPAHPHAGGMGERERTCDSAKVEATTP